MDRHARSSNSKWGDWSEWTWDDRYQRYYRVRQDRDGELDYQWDTKSTPRSHEVDHLTDDMDQLQVTMSGGSEVLADGNYTTSTSHSRQEPRRPHTERRSDKSRDKGKAKEPSHRRDERDRKGREIPEASGSKHSGRHDVYAPQMQYELGDDALRVDHTGYDRGSGSGGRSGSHPYQYDTRYGDNPQVARADYYDPQDNAQAYLQGSSRGSSSQAYSAYPADYTPDGYDQSSLHPTVTPNAVPQDSNILLADELEEVLDPRYQVKHTNCFQPGEIFKVCWAEPKGAGGDQVSVSNRHEVVNRFGEKFHVGFRRFVVVATESGSSICVPILTYSGQACRKRGVKPEKHSIIYMKGYKARLLEGEPKLGFPPVACYMTEDGETITNTSRINYSKLVTIEHNIKVFFVGRLTNDDQVDMVNDAVNTAWSARKHDRRHDRQRKR